MLEVSVFCTEFFEAFQEKLSNVANIGRKRRYYVGRLVALEMTDPSRRVVNAMRKQPEGKKV